MINSPVSKIKERLTIEEVVSTYITLEKMGTNLRARCPFHNEKTPSFFISPDRGTYYCFGCSASGDIFTFVEEFEGLDFKGALKLLAERAGVTLGTFNKEEEGEKERLYRIMEEATRYFESNMQKHLEVISYLKSRGLEEKTIKEFRIGFAQDDWRQLYTYLTTKGFSDNDMEKAGLAKRTEKGMYDRFRGRVMFPITDSSSRVIAFSGRLFESSVPATQNAIVGAKYLNSPETPIFSKSSVLYGIDKAKESIRKNNFSILVEGQMDLVLSHQAGWRNTVATSGTALSDSTTSKENAVSNLGLVRRLSNNIVLGFDGDKAGVSATSRAGKIALSLGMDVKVASLPYGLDPADLISQQGPQAWKSAIKHSVHLIEFVLNKILKNENTDTRKIGREVKEQVLPYVADLSSSIEKSYFLKKISDSTGIPITALGDDLKNIEETHGQDKKEIQHIDDAKTRMFRKDYILRRLLGIILWQQTLKEPVIDVAMSLKDLSDVINNKDIDTVLNDMGTGKEDMIFEAEVFYGNTDALKNDVRELFNNLNEESLKEKLSLKMKELSMAEESKDLNKIKQLMKELQIISRKKEDLKSGR